ncbi:hypothetical protein H4582DRAFT_2125647 [Lactarius indigo]|nr:hypothetical protein H4582DRAFT_2125647 [Lactarius indigo]
MSLDTTPSRPLSPPALDTPATQNLWHHLPMHHSSLSRISTTTSSFPQTLLNPVSPQQSPLGGLEALVQAATVERDRLEAKASLDRRPDTTRSAVQRSPELHFRSALEAPRVHLQAPAPRTPITPTIISGPLLRDSYSESSLRIGVSPEAYPSKRRRQSDSNSGSDRSWDSLPSWDSSSQFSGLMGPGIKPRGLSSEVRTAVRPTLAMSLQDTEEVGTRGRRVSPVRDHATRAQLMAEEDRTFQCRSPPYRDLAPSATILPSEGQHILPTPEPWPSLHQDIRPNTETRPPRQKVSHSDAILEKPSAPPSLPSPPSVVYASGIPAHSGGVIPASPLTSNALDSDPSSAVLVKSPSPPLPDPNSMKLNTLPPPSSPSPHPPSPAFSGSRDETNPDHPMEVYMSSASETRAPAPNPELEAPANAETSLISSGVDEVVRSPAATPPVAESSPLPMLDDLPKIDDASLSINIDDDDEASAMDSKQSQIAEQRHVDMDVDEELLSLIGDDLPSRGSQTKSKKHEFVSSEGKHSSRSPLLKQEPTPNTIILPHSSPVVNAPTLAIKQEGTSVLPADTAVGTRDSETSALKIEERLSQKKKVKHHPQPKSRVKPSGSTKTKPKAPSDGLSAAPFKSKKLSVNPTKKSALASRSRSTSAMPPGTNSAPGSENKATGEVEPDVGEEGTEDKLYCVCKTKYDDEKVMIACDRCDEWYHTSCVHMPDLEVDLVDQFICPLCVERSPHLDLRTTWKRRCLNGLKQRDPNSPDACHKPARGAFSNICTMRISFWVDNGGNRDRLWETVKGAERREGVVASARVLDIKTEDGATLAIVPPKITKADPRGAKSRNGRRRLALKSMQTPSSNVDGTSDCASVMRRWPEFGASVLESYEEGQTDVDGTQEEAEWWCMGKKKCDRHSGWQKLRIAEVEFDKEIKDQALQKLTKLEREIRKRVEDILDPQVHLGNAKMLEPSSPLSRPTVNGQSKHKPNGDIRKKGKKKKSSTSSFELEHRGNGMTCKLNLRLDIVPTSSGA